MGSGDKWSNGAVEISGATGRWTEEELEKVKSDKEKVGDCREVGRTDGDVFKNSRSSDR